MSRTIFQRAFGRMVSDGGGCPIRLVRLLDVLAGNRYRACEIELAPSGPPQALGDEFIVTNLAERPDLPGRVPSGTDALAADVGGNHVAYVAVGGGSAAFPARVVSAAAGGYLIREQALDGSGNLADVAGSVDVPAVNLAELSTGPGGAVDAGQVVLALAIADSSSPPAIRYLFDRAVYAKYLD